MKKLIDNGFVLTLIILAVIAIVIGMVAGPFGETSVSIGASIGACIFSVGIILFGLSNWKKKRK